jgi:hypothetical protein
VTPASAAVICFGRRFQFGSLKWHADALPLAKELA